MPKNCYYGAAIHFFFFEKRSKSCAKNPSKTSLIQRPIIAIPIFFSQLVIEIGLITGVGSVILMLKMVVTNISISCTIISFEVNFVSLSF